MSVIPLGELDQYAVTTETPVDPIEDLRSKVLAELDRLRVLQDLSTKDAYRALHSVAVQLQLKQHQQWLQRKYPKYAGFFANGIDVVPSNISPELIEVTSEGHSDLFRVARLTWSLPFTKGYGRRLRFLVMDKANEKLIGIIGLQSPPLDFPARDLRFKYPKGEKIGLVNQTMDIYTLGAVPPYSRLLGGKLVALAAASREVREAYRRKYEGRTTEMESTPIAPHLVALTTTSAFGRSSIYNRLRYKDRLIAESLGYTQGYGSFHLSSFYKQFKDLLETQGVSTRGGFGVGPRIVWQTNERAFRKLGLPKALLQHGLQREAFLFALISNLDEYMAGETDRPIYYNEGFSDFAEWWRERWLMPRAQRVDGWHAWDKSEIQKMLLLPAAIREDGQHDG